ncbi:SpoIIE family protein phosphatase [Streptomyces sp. NPDC050560]|uniref:SpoIIE family protein phosphatase n=1 Tax=Streptomyces sp. NPDC050560 TaxID=3365630 RepID=UPI0037B435A1
MLGDLLAASHVVTLEEIPTAAGEHASRVGWTSVGVYLADLQQQTLSPLGEGGPASEAGIEQTHGGASGGPQGPGGGGSGDGAGRGGSGDPPPGQGFSRRGASQQRASERRASRQESGRQRASRQEASPYGRSSRDGAAADRAPGDQPRRNAAPGNGALESVGNDATGNAASENPPLGNDAPGDPAPGNKAPGGVATGNTAPGNGAVPGDKPPDDKTSDGRKRLPGSEDEVFRGSAEHVASGHNVGAIAIEGTAAGRAYQSGCVTVDGRQWWVPLLDGTERLGVMGVTAGAGARMDQAAARQLRDLAALVTLMLVSKRGTSDSYARLVRRRGMNVAAEMEWRLMPPRTFATGRVLISAVMEPAYEVSGDAFDYAVAGDSVHVSLFDAMGHNLAAGLTAGLATAACRNHRRQHGGLVESAEAVERALLAEFGGERYATGILLDLDTTSGLLTWTNRGHYPPVVLRGARDVIELHCPPAPPMGTGLGMPGTLAQDQLEPGDRLLLYTDGVTEARSPGGEEFGLARLTDFLMRYQASQDLPVPEVLRRLIRHHLDYHQGRLNDDATILLLEWHGPVAYPPGRVEALVGLPYRSLPGEGPTRPRPLGDPRHG